ncbi:GTPase Era [Gammaproteobacteria bacterium 45_16_T64]|nr:GTPase Era [Gammaproteobacteria bacterium 45_16_T64]
MTLIQKKTQCGYAAIVGRPNVGKSTLLNHILGQKISITSRKPQTTRHRVLGIKTENEIQTIYVDTPGIHLDEPKAINRYMNKAATTSVNDVDVIVFVIEGNKWTDADQHVLNKIQRTDTPIVLVVNKMDTVDDKDAMLPHINLLASKGDFAAIIPVSALKGQQLDQLEKMIGGFLPESEHFYPEDQITDRSMRFMAAEMVREKIMRQLGQELPYAMTVEVEEFSFETGVYHIAALILVERSGQKAIIIGKQGARLKKIGMEARKDMERMLDSKVMLRLFVKVKGGWSDDERALKSLGYDDL